MLKIRKGTLVTALACYTQKSVSGEFCGYELSDIEDPTSIVGKVFSRRGRDEMVYVEVSSIKVAEGADEKTKRDIIVILKRTPASTWEKANADFGRCLEWVQKRGVPTAKEKQYIETIKTIMDFYLADKKDYDKDYYDYIEEWLDSRHVDVNVNDNIGTVLIKYFSAQPEHYLFCGLTRDELCAWIRRRIPSVWRDDDERMRHAILQDLENIHEVYPKMNLQDEIDWLNRLEPSHWKPTDEQMMYLAAAIEESNENGVLDSLYNDLNKL